jgi:hypothetical protein
MTVTATGGAVDVTVSRAVAASPSLLLQAAKSPAIAQARI